MYGSPRRMAIRRCYCRVQRRTYSFMLSNSSMFAAETDATKASSLIVIVPKAPPGALCDAGLHVRVDHEGVGVTVLHSGQ